MYFRFIIFYFLGILENWLNFMCSLLNFYPAIDWQYPYWIGSISNKTSKNFLAGIKNGKNLEKR